MPVRETLLASRWVDPILFRSGLHNLLVVGAFLVLISGHEIATFYANSGVGTIATRSIICEKPNNNRCTYVFTYVSGSSFTNETTPDVDAADLLPGRRIEKDAFTFRYRVDGVSKGWSALRAQLIMLALGSTCLLAWPLRSVRAAFKRIDDRMHNPLW